jgi:hypothetical protein
MTGDGFTVDFDPNMTAQEFIALFLKIELMIFTAASRGVVVLITTYSVRTDWWSSNIALYEYGINEQIFPSQIRSYPFKPNFYESMAEGKHFFIDLIRIGASLIIILAGIIVKVSIISFLTSFIGSLAMQIKIAFKCKNSSDLLC